MHVPIHDKRIVRAWLRFIKDYQPDEIVCIGDLLDYPQPSRWSKDTREEFEGSVFADSDAAKREFLTPLREVYGGPFGVIPGNHDTRPRDYLRKYAPALGESNAFDLDVLLDFEKYDTRLLPDFYDVAPGWVATHGHKGGIRLSQISGMTALSAAKKFGKSVVMGHTHRAGIIRHTVGFGGDVTSDLTGMEVGHFVNVPLAGYLKGSTPNWQTAFGILHVDGTYVRAELVPVEKGRFEVEGQVYKL